MRTSVFPAGDGGSIPTPSLHFSKCKKSANRLTKEETDEVRRRLVAVAKSLQEVDA